jgi:hypothetical protein
VINRIIKTNKLEHIKMKKGNLAAAAASKAKEV